MNRIILECRPAWATPLVRELPFEWREFEPLARAEASKFYWKQERGQFRFDDIYSEAATALADGKSVKHAVECIRGALKDFARDGDKFVKDVELAPEEWQRTHGGPDGPERPTQGPWRAYFENGVQVIVCPLGPYLRTRSFSPATASPASTPKSDAPSGATLFDDDLEPGN